MIAARINEIWLISGCIDSAINAADIVIGPTKRANASVNSNSNVKSTGYSKASRSCDKSKNVPCSVASSTVT